MVTATADRVVLEDLSWLMCSATDAVKEEQENDLRNRQERLHIKSEGTQNPKSPSSGQVNNKDS